MKTINKNFRINNSDEDINSMLQLKTHSSDEELLKALQMDYSYTPEISSVKNVLSITPQTVKIENVFEAIKNGTYREQIEEIRNTDDPNLKRDLKKELPAIMFGGTFKNDRQTLSEASRLICIDFDHVEDLKRLVFLLQFSTYVYMYFVSPSGDGLKVIVRTNVKTEEEYKEEINMLFKHFKKEGLEPDTSKQSINDLCFYSYDPNAYMNTSATIWREIDWTYLRVPGDDKIVESVEYIIDQIESLEIDITKGKEICWDIGLGLANKFGNEGREYFHQICKKNEAYNKDEWNIQYDQCINSSEFGSISSLIYFADSCNLKILPKPSYLNNSKARKSEYAGFPLTVENILKVTNGGMLFYKYLIPKLRGGGKRKKNVKNPFYNDTRGSLSLYKYEDRWYFRDYGEISFSGDVFDFAKYHYKLPARKDFYQILININRDLELGLIDGGRKKVEPDFIYKPNSSEENTYEVYYKKSFSEDELTYWNQYGISKETLNVFNVKSVSKMNLIQPSGKSYVFYSKRENPIFAYVYSKQLIKIYKPFDEKVRFFWIGEKNGASFFGYDQCQRSEHMGDCDLILTGGEKDVMSLYKLDYFSISLNSETSLIPKEFLIELKYFYKSVLVLYDIDETGVKSSKFLAEKYNLKSVHLPKEILGDNGKDISDYLAIGGSKEVLEELIERASESYVKEKEASAINSAISESADNTEENIQDNKEDKEPEDDKEQKHKNEPKQEVDGDPEQTEVLNEKFPYVTKKVLNLLPMYLKESVSLFDNEREMDVFLYSSIGVISGFLPNVFGHYDGHEVFPNLYLLILAPPASNKSVAKWARKMGENLHNSYKKNYEEELIHYNESFDQGDNQSNNSGNKLEKPERKLIFIPANSSATAFLQTISKNGDNGILFETEADTLGETLAHDWGNYSDSLRKAFHHEILSYARRGNGELIEISEPKLSVVLSGTPGQIRTLISDVENGLFSRFMFYYFEEKPFWKDTFKIHERYIYNDEFKILGSRLSDFYQKLEGLDYDVKFDFTYEQKESFKLKFKKWLTEYVSLYGDSTAATSKRLGLITFRIAMILSMLRFMDKENIPEEIYCSDEDYKVSLIIAENLLKHASLVFKLLPQKNSLRVKGSEIKQKFYDALPNTFSYQESLEVADSNSLKHKTAGKYLYDFVEDGGLIRPEHGKYKKS